jgi:hypothetical protein
MTESVPRTGLCRNCSQPMLLGIDAVWRHTYRGQTPGQTRWCLDWSQKDDGSKSSTWGCYIWPLMDAEPEKEAASA